jgi:hypothetical protein
VYLKINILESQYNHRPDKPPPKKADNNKKTTEKSDLIVKIGGFLYEYDGCPK